MASDYRDYVIPGRSCGSCTACCSALAITEADLQKVAGALCSHCASGSCAIYETRPQVCRDFNCVWRGMPALDESWRPNLSGVMIMWSAVPQGWRSQHGVDIVLLASPETLDLDKIVSLVTGFIARGVATYIDVPVGSGLQHARGFVNDLLGPSIAARDRARADELVRAAIDKLQAMAPPDMTA